MSKKTRRPNILWICTDQQRHDTLGCYGNRFVRTPHIDRLASDGILFDRCYSQNPVSAPSRASFLTGRYPRTTRCRQNGQSIPPDERLITKILADQGYTCGLSGKLHLSANHPSVCKSVERRIADGYAEFHWSHGPQQLWPENAYGKWLQAKNVKYGETPCPLSKHVSYGMPSEHHQTTWCIETAMNFIEAHGKDEEPWLFSINMYDPHHPFDPPRDYLERYISMLEDIPLPNAVEGEWESKPVFQQIDHGRFPNLSEQDHKMIRAAYWAMVDHVDAQVGRLIQRLEELGQRDDTLIIFMSDHGEMLGDHGIYYKGPYFYEAAVHVPLIFSWPKFIPTGRRSAALVELTDLAPTLLDAAGLDAVAGMQGQSIWPILTGSAPSDEHRDSVFSEYYNSMPGHRDPAAHCSMVFNGRYKLTRCHGVEPGELYDLEKDPEETTNLWNASTHQSVKVEMLALLCDRMAYTVDPLPPREAVW